jgi:hypothetical protein
MARTQRWLSRHPMNSLRLSLACLVTLTIVRSSTVAVG